MDDKKDKSYRGRCLCGAVQYEATGTPRIVAHCHCEDCQRVSGAGHSTGAIFSVKNIRITGELREFRVRSENGTEVTRGFCPTCGSSIFGCNDAMPGFRTISLGTMDDSSDLVPAVIVFSRNQKEWDVMDEALPAYEAQPAWRPDDE